jgi:hypothetical protein
VRARNIRTSLVVDKMPESARGPSTVTGWKGMYSHELATPKIETALVWLRRDLRVDDNPALVAAIRSAKNVVSIGFAPMPATYTFPPLPRLWTGPLLRLWVACGFQGIAGCCAETPLFSRGCLCRSLPHS